MSERYFQKCNFNKVQKAAAQQQQKGGNIYKCEIKPQTKAGPCSVAAKR